MSKHSFGTKTSQPLQMCTGNIGMEAKRRIQQRLVRFVKEQAESRETLCLVLKGTPAPLQ
jgi:hypothetical protein